MSKEADDVYQSIREYRTFLTTGTPVRRRGFAALKFTGETTRNELKKYRKKLEESAWEALKGVQMKSADLFELLFLARRLDMLGFCSDKEVKGGLECVKADILDELDSALERLESDNVESTSLEVGSNLESSEIHTIELMRRANEHLDYLLCSCGPPSQFELWQYWLDVKVVEQLIACLHNLQLSMWAVKLAQEAKEAVKSTEEFQESTRWMSFHSDSEKSKHKHLIAQECGRRNQLAFVLCEIRQQLRRISSGSGRKSGKELAQAEQLVTLSQMAATVSRMKRTLERYVASMPQPKIRGRGGKPSEWAWTEVRPWLEKQFGRKLPLDFPASRIRPG